MKGKRPKVEDPVTAKPNEDQVMADDVPFNTLLPRKFERLSLVIDPDFQREAVSMGVIGFERPFAARLPVARYYTMNLDLLRERFTAILSAYLTDRLVNQTMLSLARIEAEVNTITPIAVNACFAAIYANLKTIHRFYQKYASRYTAPSLYSEDLELLLPFADAVASLGVFTPLGSTVHYSCVPTFPENVLNEGCSTQIFAYYEYEYYLPQLKALGIPVKSVDTRQKNGSPWWTYKFEWFQNHYDLHCIFAPINYTDHSALLASMFAAPPAEGKDPAQIVGSLADDQTYPVRARDNPDGFQIRAFSALCHAPHETWNQYLLLQ